MMDVRDCVELKNIRARRQCRAHIALFNVTYLECTNSLRYLLGWKCSDHPDDNPTRENDRSVLLPHGICDRLEMLRENMDDPQVPFAGKWYGDSYLQVKGIFGPRPKTSSQENRPGKNNCSKKQTDRNLSGTDENMSQVNKIANKKTFRISKWKALQTRQYPNSTRSYDVDYPFAIKYCPTKKCFVYLMRWRGWLPRSDTWEPEVNIGAEGRTINPKTLWRGNWTSPKEFDPVELRMKKKIDKESKFSVVLNRLKGRFWFSYGRLAFRENCYLHSNENSPFVSWLFSEDGSFGGESNSEGMIISSYKIEDLKNKLRTKCFNSVAEYQYGLFCMKYICGNQAVEELCRECWDLWNQSHPGDRDMKTEMDFRRQSSLSRGVEFKFIDLLKCVFPKEDIQKEVEQKYMNPPALNYSIINNNSAIEILKVSSPLSNRSSTDIRRVSYNQTTLNAFWINLPSCKPMTPAKDIRKNNQTTLKSFFNTVDCSPDISVDCSVFDYLCAWALYQHPINKSSVIFKMTPETLQAPYPYARCYFPDLKNRWSLYMAMVKEMMTIKNNNNNSPSISSRGNNDASPKKRITDLSIQFDRSPTNTSNATDHNERLVKSFSEKICAGQVQQSESAQTMWTCFNPSYLGQVDPKINAEVNGDFFSQIFELGRFFGCKETHSSAPVDRIWLPHWARYNKVPSKYSAAMPDYSSFLVSSGCLLPSFSSAVNLVPHRILERRESIDKKSYLVAFAPFGNGKLPPCQWVPGHFMTNNYPYLVILHHIENTISKIFNIIPISILIQVPRVFLGLSLTRTGSWVKTNASRILRQNISDNRMAAVDQNTRKKDVLFGEEVCGQVELKIVSSTDNSEYLPHAIDDTTSCWGLIQVSGTCQLVAMTILRLFYEYDNFVDQLDKDLITGMKKPTTVIFLHPKMRSLLYECDTDVLEALCIHGWSATDSRHALNMLFPPYDEMGRDPEPDMLPQPHWPAGDEQKFVDALGIGYPLLICQPPRQTGQILHTLISDLGRRMAGKLNATVRDLTSSLKTLSNLRKKQKEVAVKNLKARSAAVNTSPPDGEGALDGSDKYFDLSNILGLGIRQGEMNSVVQLQRQILPKRKKGRKADSSKARDINIPVSVKLQSTNLFWHENRGRILCLPEVPDMTSSEFLKYSSIVTECINYSGALQSALTISTTRCGKDCLFGTPEGCGRSNGRRGHVDELQIGTPYSSFVEKYLAENLFHPYSLFMMNILKDKDFGRCAFSKSEIDDNAHFILSKSSKIFGAPGPFGELVPQLSRSQAGDGFGLIGTFDRSLPVVLPQPKIATSSLSPVHEEIAMDVDGEPINENSSGELLNANLSDVFEHTSGNIWSIQIGEEDSDLEPDLLEEEVEKIPPKQKAVVRNRKKKVQPKPKGRPTEKKKTPKTVEKKD